MVNPKSLNNYDQVIIFGASGWIGRTAIEVLLAPPFAISLDKLLLIGSTNSFIQVNNLEIKIFDKLIAFQKISSNSIFLNCAFLRREVLKDVGVESYIKTNLELMSYTKRVINEKKIKGVINFSSGIAESIGKTDLESSDVVYAALKRFDELWLKEACHMNNSTLLNCRVYSISGFNINNIKDLILGKLIADALRNETSVINSPFSKRKYVDAGDLVKVLLLHFLSMSIGSQSDIESGGVLVSIQDLAEKIQIVLPNFTFKVNKENSKEPSLYYGEQPDFDILSNSYSVKLLGIEEQIKITAKGISSTFVHLLS